ncbi:hypothetical protein EBX93_19065 [bacterium]|nr:hypothetical protein [bacterium]
MFWVCPPALPFCGCFGAEPKVAPEAILNLEILPFEVSHGVVQAHGIREIDHPLVPCTRALDIILHIIKNMLDELFQDGVFLSFILDLFPPWNILICEATHRVDQGQVRRSDTMLDLFG